MTELQIRYRLKTFMAALAFVGCSHTSPVPVQTMPCSDLNGTEVSQAIATNVYPGFLKRLNEQPFPVSPNLILDSSNYVYSAPVVLPQTWTMTPVYSAPIVDLESNVKITPVYSAPINKK